MSYVRNQEKIADRDDEVVSFEMVSGASVRLIYQTDDPSEIIGLAYRYKADPEVIFEGLSRTGHLMNTWTIREVLDGTFEATL